MAEANFSLGQVNFTGHLIINAIKVSDPLTIAATQSIPPEDLNTSINISFSGLDPTTYWFDFRESPDGVAQGVLWSRFKIVLERLTDEFTFKFYVVDGPNPGDPVSGQNELIDSTLDGETILSVFKEGFRFLIPNIEYELIAGGGIRLLGGTIFSPGEVFLIQIAKKIIAEVVTSQMFAGVVTLTGDTTLNSSHYNKLIKLAASGPRLVITFPDVSTMPDGKFFYFTTFGGSQFQTKFITQAGNQIDGYGTELAIGKKEVLWIEKRSTMFNVLNDLPGVEMVGQIVILGTVSHINVIPEDGRLLDGDDYPRPWKWLVNVLEGTHQIIDDAVTGGGYVHPNGKRGLFVRHSTLKKFRMPNMQGLTHKGLKNFTAYNTDSNRLYDYPGGIEPEQVGTHDHPSGTQANDGDPDFNGAATHPVIAWLVAATTLSRGTKTKVNTGTKNIVENAGVIYGRRI